MSENVRDLMTGIKGDRKTGRQVTRAAHAGGRTCVLKIVVDVIKDTESTEGGRQGVCYGSDLSKQERFSLAAPLVCSIWMSHDLQTWWHREEGENRNMQRERNVQLICPFKSGLQKERFPHRESINQNTKKQKKSPGLTDLVAY